MAYYAKEEDRWVELNEYAEYDEPEEHHMEEQLVQALDTHVQGSVNRALIKALQHFTKPLKNYGKRKFGAAQGETSAEVLVRKARNVLHDHGSVSSSKARKAPGTQTEETDESSAAAPDTSDSDQESQASQKVKERKHKSHNVEDKPVNKNLLFDPRNIIHPRSTEWVPCFEVAHYVQDNLRRGFKKEVSATLRSECPRSSLMGKVADTPEIDPNMDTFMKHFAKDPKKGLDRAWRGCQDKLLDVTRPLTKILDAAVTAKESNTPLDPTKVLEWAQRAMCFLGNANCALSAEQRQSFLVRIDPQLPEMANTEPGTLANGMLFGEKFVKEMGKYVNTFSTLDKAQANIQKVFHTGLFNRAGRFRGRATGRGSNQTSRGFEQRSRGGGQRSKFYPSRNRGDRGRQHRGYSGQYSSSGDTSYSEYGHGSSSSELDGPTLTRIGVCHQRAEVHSDSNAVNGILGVSGGLGCSTVTITIEEESSYQEGVE
ncbi:uncharacterized protein LOC144784190 [Lissotriton helveticus]